MREMIMREFPDHGIWGEEFGQYNPRAEYSWMLDPIDGTKSFISGSPLFGTLIALMRNGRPVLGVINHPALNQCLIGAEGETRLNGEKVSVRPCATIENAVLLTSSHWDVHEHQNGPAFDVMSKRTRIYRTWGDCYGYSSLAAGFSDIMLDPIMNPWDIMALVPVVEGAGGRITDWHGNDPVSGTSIIATAGPIHDAVVRTLNP